MALLGCRPVELDPNDPGDRQILKMTFVYKGSVERSCSRCGCAVWLGPRQQQLEGVGAIVCFRCSRADVVDGAVPRHLGNPQPNPHEADRG